MKAIVIREFGGPDVLRWEDVETPTPAAGEVLVRVHAVSVNRTLDLQVRQDGGNYGVTLPLVLGNDPSGVVAAAGPEVDAVKIGDRVAVFGGVGCGRCQHCTAGHQRRCASRRMLGVQCWGGYAEYVKVPGFWVDHPTELDEVVSTETAGPRQPKEQVVPYSHLLDSVAPPPHVG